MKRWSIGEEWWPLFCSYIGDREYNREMKQTQRKVYAYVDVWFGLVCVLLESLCLNQIKVLLFSFLSPISVFLRLCSS